MLLGLERVTGQFLPHCFGDVHTLDDGRRINVSMAPGSIPVTQLLRDAGYTTAHVGKWHLGFGGKAPDWNGELKPGPLELGFDYYFGMPVVNSAPPYVYVQNDRVVADQICTGLCVA